MWRGTTSAKYGLINYRPALEQRSFIRTPSATVGTRLTLRRKHASDRALTFAGRPEHDLSAVHGSAGACPPEDCGGIGGFYSLLKALQNPRHPQHEELLEWVGEEYDPEKFSIEAINRILHGRKKRAARSLD